MNKFFALLLAVLALSVAPVWAAPVADPERVADAFASIDVVQYDGTFEFTRVLASGATEEVQGEFTLNLDGTIPRLAINGVQVVNWGDKPLGGLPVNKLGSATNFWLQLNGWDGVAGRYSVYGWASDNLLLPSDTIIVQMNLSWQEEFVPFDADGRDPAQLILRLGGSEASYDASRGGFSIWYNPAEETDYEIVDSSTGQVLRRGNLVDGLAEANIVNFALPDGVRELFSAGRNSVYLQNQWPSSIERDGEWLPAQVYVARTHGQALSLELSGLSYGGRLEVYSVDEDVRVLVAEAEVVVVDPPGMGKGGYYNPTYLSVPAGYDRLVVEVIGNTSGWSSFNLWAYAGPVGKG